MSFCPNRLVLFSMLTAGETHDQVTRNMYEAIEMHIRDLVEDMLPVPESHSFAEVAAVPSEGP